MSIWQIFPGDDCSLRWEHTGNFVHCEPEVDLNISPNGPLPSMTDLLVQVKGRKSLDDGEKDSKIFRTKLGKLAVVKESSMAKGLSLLGGDEDINSDLVLPTKSADGYSGSLFQTGSGKKVNVSAAGIARARALLGLEPENAPCQQKGFQIPRKLQVPSDESGWQDSSSFKYLIKNSETSVSVNAPCVQRGFKTPRKAKLPTDESGWLDSSGFAKCAVQSFETSVSVNGSCHHKGFQFPSKLQTPTDESEWQDSSVFWKGHLPNIETPGSVSTPRLLQKLGSGSGGSKTLDGKSSFLMNTKIFQSAQEPQFKFRTAGGRSLSVSTGALKRARSLLGDPDIGSFLDEVGTYNHLSSVSEEIRVDATSSNKESNFSTFSHQEIFNNGDKDFTSPLRSYSKKMKSCSLGNSSIGTNLIEKFEEAANARSLAFMSNAHTSSQKLSGNKILEPNPTSASSVETGAGSRITHVQSSSGRALADVSNIMPLTYSGSEQIRNKKRRIGRMNFVSPFKRPRSSKFLTPFKDEPPHARNGTSTQSAEHSRGTRSVSTRYPFRFSRVSLKQYFDSLLSTSNTRGKQIKKDNADKHLFSDKFSYDCISMEAYRDMLANSGASAQYISKEWVTNHCKWIVWKLASYERHHEAYFPQMLTTSNVLEELKYRYEREVNYGHRSAIRKILEGDASPSMMMVLCISAISSDCRPNIEINNSSGDESTTNLKVEVTDGWYSMKATLDILLSKQLSAGKLFVGQKIRIWGARLIGWVGPISPLEILGSVSLLLNINGTYRAHWADKLGFCKGAGPPLAFRCIKSDGGQIPRTLAGITRRYPVLYKERLRNGCSVIRSEKMETKAAELHNQRRLAVTEGIIAQKEMGINCPTITEIDDSEEAKIRYMLETAEEPDILMADMSHEQLVALSKYNLKLEARRQSEMEKCIKTALANAGLNEREVTPFMKVRVIGLRSTYCSREERTKDGTITIWNPTEKQKHELVEGHAFTITGLMPSHSGAGTLYLQATGSMTKWHTLSPSAAEQFQPFFTPRKSIPLSSLGEIPISSEFDVAALVVHVGESYSDPITTRKKQWVFVTDYSASESLLGICFCSYVQDDSFAPVNSNLVGSTVGFCNLVNKPKDWKYHVWVAEANCNSTYSVKFDVQNSHLKKSATSVQTWAKVSSPIINKLRQKVLFIIGQTSKDKF